MTREFQFDSLTARVYSDRNRMAEAVVQEIKAAIGQLLLKKQEINILFAAAPSQSEVLEGLRCSDGIPWNQINAFHMDEYIGLGTNAVQGFGNFLSTALFNHVPLKNVFYLGRSGLSPEEDCLNYSSLLKSYPLDITLLGIGENGHIAFNDPPVADFKDKKAVKIVSLDQTCRQQQVNDGCFNHIEDVPETALTLTIPELIKPEYLFCTVPGELKMEAVSKTLYGPIAESCPASVLRTVKTKLYMDPFSGACIPEKIL